MAIERIRGRKLQEQRLRVWLANPLCAHCKRITVYPSGFEMDHIIALTNDGTNNDSNMQVLHLDCHVAKTNADLGYEPKVATGSDGWPVEQSQAASTTARWKRAAKG
jgi:5-methylcytosine-specific restriction protein A